MLIAVHPGGRCSSRAQETANAPQTPADSRSPNGGHRGHGQATRRFPKMRSTSEQALRYHAFLPEGS